MNPSNNFPLLKTVLVVSHCISATGIKSFYYTQSKIHCWSRSRDKTSHTEKQLPVFPPRLKINNAQAAALARVVSPVIGRYSGGPHLIGREIN